MTRLRFLLPLFALALSACAGLAPKERSDVEQLLRQGQAQEERGDYPQALLSYVKAASDHPKSAEAHFRVARTQLAMGNADVADQAFRRALALDPKHTGALEGLGLLLLQQGLRDDGAALLKKVHDQDRQHWRTENALGVLADLRGDHEEARVCFERALAAGGNRPELLNNAGYSRYQAGDLKAARTFIQRALAQAPDYAMAWNNLALIRVRQGDAAGAIDALQETVKPHQAYNDVGYLLYLQGDYAQARTYLRRAIALAPSYYTVAQQNLDRVNTELRMQNVAAKKKR